MYQTNCFDRRQLLRSGSAAGLSTWLGNLLASDATAKNGGNRPAAYKRCITLWMEGGPSQIDTFDPKPESETGGPLHAVSTNVPGVQFCETLAGLGKHADDLCVIRSIESRQGEHERASHLLHTGFERIDSFPRPALGAFVSSRDPVSEIPGFVTLGQRVYGPAFLGTQHGPFVVGDLAKTSTMIQGLKQRSDRIELVNQLNGRFNRQSHDKSVHQRAEQIESVRSLLDSPFAETFNTSAESKSTRQRYGDSDFGQNVLVARRMLESGVRYVEVQMPGWDTHVANFAAVKRLCGQLEPAWIALMEDLKSSGLWDDTLILWMGEFGRTPIINAQSGRDHFPASIPVVLAGHSIGGRVIGSTGKDGQGHSSGSSSVADLMYTLMTLLGVDPDRELTTSFGSPTSATDEGSMIDGISTSMERE